MRKVLITDDDILIRRIFRRLLERRFADLIANDGLKILIAESGMEALELARLEMPDLILMDVKMPGLDGIETFYKIREIRGGLFARTYFITGYAGTDGSRLQQAIHDGAIGYAAKPISGEQLGRIVERHALGNQR